MIKKAIVLFVAAILFSMPGNAQLFPWYFQVDENFLLGKINFEEDIRFSLVAAKRSTKSCYLLFEVNWAFEEMAAAPASGKTMTPASKQKIESFSTATNDSQIKVMRELLKNKK